MHLTELVLQGVRGFIGPRKFVFKPGLNAILGQKGSGKSTLRDLLLDLFFQRPVEQTRAFYHPKGASGSGSDPCRAGMSFQAGDQLYRKVVDLSQGNIVLSRFNASNASFEPFIQNPDQIREFFRQELRFSSREVFTILYSSQSEEFPSRKAMGATSAGLSSLSSQGGQFQDKESLLREIHSLRKLYDDALNIKKLQFELDGCHKEMFELSDLVKKEDKILEKMQTVKMDLDPLGRLPELPDNLESRIDDYDKSYRKFQNELPGLNQEIAELKEELSFSYPDPLAKDSQFLASSVVFIVSIIVAILTSGKDVIFGMSYQYFLLILFPVAMGSLILGFMRFFKFLSATQRAQSLEREIRNRTEKLKKLERKFEVETSVIRNMMKSLNVETTQEMSSNIQKIQTFQSQMAQYQKQLDAARARPDYVQAKEKLPGLKKNASEIEQELQLLSSVPLDPSALESQILELEGQARNMGITTGAHLETTAQQTPQEFDRNFIERVGRDYFYHPTLRLIAVCAFALNITIQEFLSKVLNPLDKNLMALSFQNMGQPRIELDGTCSIVEISNQTRVRFEQLEPFKQDLVYFALKFTLLQFLLRDIPLPLILDSAFLSFDERLAPVISKSVKFLSQQTQVILLTDKEIYAQGADHLERI